jgi:vanillate O-demethylase monooxygenase subunit
MAEYLRNCWYAFAWSGEVGGGLFTRKVLDQTIVAFRRADGAPAALLDRCPHRFAPLSLGRKVDDSIRCVYHGLGFGGDGACVHNPFSAKTPVKGRARAFPLAERFGMIWIWPGDPERADPALVPDFAFHVSEQAADNWTIFGYTNMATNYEVETDNLMDLSHIETLHAPSFGGRGYIFAGEHQLHERGEALHSNWWIPDVQMVDPTTNEPAGHHIDHYIDMRWTAPSNMALHVGFIPLGKYREHAKGDRAALPGQWSAHILTPETETTTHYFWSATNASDFTAGMAPEAARGLFRQAFEDED